MASLITSEKMVVGYDNQLIRSHTVEATPIVTTNFSMIGNSLKENLLYEDPSRRFHANPSGTEQTIEFHMTDLTQSPQNILFGFFDWLEPSRYDTVLLEWADTVPTWNSYATVDLTGMTTADGLPGGPRNMLFRVDTVVEKKFWRFRFQNTAAPQPFSISNIVMFKGFEVTQSPDTGGVTIGSQRPPKSRRATGGASHLSRPKRYKEEFAEFRWSRASRAMVKQLDFVNELWGDQLVGAIPPQTVGEIVPTSIPHVIGRTSALTMNAQKGASFSEHVQQVTWRIQGAK